MKLFFGVVGLVILCSGCASETGVYYENTGWVNYSSETLDVKPRFKVEKPKPALADLGKSALIGKWRVRINKDYIVYKNRDDLMKTGKGGRSSQWELYEYEFKTDGTYSIRGVLKDGKTILKGVGEDGKWKYDNGVLHFKSECCLSPGMYSFSEPNRVQGVKNFDCRVTWHSDKEFTLEYADPANPPMSDYVTCIGMGWFGTERVPYFDRMTILLSSGSHYDSQGCFHYRGNSGLGVSQAVSVVVSSQRFKRID